MHTTVRRSIVGLTASVLFCLPLLHVEARVPFAGRAEGSVTAFQPGPDGVAITVVAQGTATHLGLFSREEHLVLNPAAGTFEGTIVFTAADGDQLVGTLTGAFVSPTAATGVYTFNGGSGRFDGTTGDVAFVLTTPDGVHFTATFEGSLDRD